MITKFRNSVTGGVYRHVLKPVFFRNDPETVHDRMARFGALLGSNPMTRALTAATFGFADPGLRQDILGIHFKNPIGLSAGFDKNAELTDILPSVGFGFAEVGSITGERCEGNPKPRLWRLPESKSLVVYYGLKNDGCEAIAARLAGKHFDIPIGMSVAMTNCAENLDTTKAIEDYAKAFKVMAPFGSYVTINISCPNTQSDQPFTDPEKLELLLTRIDSIPSEKPIFLKLSPDLDRAKIDYILEVVRNHRVHGLICTNLTKKRDNPKILDGAVPEKGGISGKVVEGLADDLLSYIYNKEGRRFVLIGSGGVSSAADAYKKIRLGASLVQIITGMIFEGPQLISEINRGLVDLLRQDGFASVKDAIGADSGKIARQ